MGENEIIKMIESKNNMRKHKNMDRDNDLFSLEDKRIILERLRSNCEKMKSELDEIIRAIEVVQASIYYDFQE